jgi:hypothetical protein
VSSVSSLGDSDSVALARPMVKALFVASCLLAVVSWFTTEQGMALYLNSWFSVLASLGVQTSLVVVAWLIGFTKTRRALLIAVYAITAIVSIAFSYVSLYTWFSARERPALVERQLYDALQSSAARTNQVLSGAVAETQKHVLALDEMTAAEKSHGFISRAQDADPYLASVRDAVAREAQTYNHSYREGSGEGLRYTAFDRYAKLARQSLAQLQQSQASLAEWRAQTKPLDPTEKQLRAFRQVYDAVPWSEAEQQLHRGKLVPPAVPAYTDFVDQSASGQEDLMLAFQGLLTAPTNRHVFAFALAAFIDIIVFLLAFSSGPYFFGSPEQRWAAASAVVDTKDPQIFVRDLLRKMEHGGQNLVRVDDAALSPGEKQFLLVLAARDLATADPAPGPLGYLIDQRIHESLLESLATPKLPLRAAAGSALS